MELKKRNEPSEYKITRYISSDFDEWNAFVENAKNATFLFHRDFMEYHQDRFEDFSLLVYKKGRLIALLPANKVGDKVYSHQGLSYGGFIVNKNLRFQDYALAFKAVLAYLETLMVKSLHIKTLPGIYHTNINEEMRYIMSVVEAKQDTFDSYFVIDDGADYKPNRNRRRALKLAEQKNAKLTVSGIGFFWEHILTQNLQKRFNTKPVHTLEEILTLQAKFPNNIVFHAVEIDNRIEAGALIFISDNVAHFQYSSGTDKRSTNGALDFLFHEIIKIYRNKKYISFGSSSTDKSLKINKGLAYWKESFGARLMLQDAYVILPKNHIKLNDIYI